MLRSQKKTAFMQVAATHVDVFVEYYDLLKQWALRFTKHDRELAEDLLHDAFIHFTLTKPDLSSIENLDNYLYVVMRNLHLSQMRKATRNPIRTLTVVEYDTIDIGLWASDPRDELRLRADLSAVCQYACIRKETSKVGSILILRFFHGYYPEEIAEVMRVSRPQVDNGLRDSRMEARAYLEDPNSISFFGDKSASKSTNQQPEQTGDLRLALRKQIFGARHGDCTPADEIKNLYDPDARSIGTRILAHAVSCQDCLENINTLLGLPPLASRYAVDTIGKDPGPKDKTGGGGTGGGGGAGGSNMLDSFLRFRDAYYHHQPEELCISVNGLFQGAHKVAANKNEMRLVIDTPEPLGFVEVFSEQGLRLLMLNVEPPPTGEGDQSIRVELSSGRTLDANLSFSGQSPSLQITYTDPLYLADPAIEATEAPGLVADSAKPIITFPVKNDSWRFLNFFGGWRSWFQPVRLTAAFAGLLIAALLFYKLAPTTVSAAELLNKSAEQEIAQLANKERVLHRTLDLEEYREGQLASRKKIDVWHSAELGVTARRLYDEQGRLITGDWRNASGIQTIYQKDQAAKLQPVPEKRGTAVLFEDAWQLSLSAKEFTALVANTADATLEERDNEYLISYEPKSEAANLSVPPAVAGLTQPPKASRITKASLTLSKEDLHAIEQTIALNNGTEYRFREVSYEWRPADSVAPAMFEPNVELTGASQGTTTPSGETPATPPLKDGELADANSNTNTAPTATLATAALEVEVIDLLNNAGAFMGEQISVQRTAAGQIQVNALVETDKRKAELNNALASVRNNPAVRINIETVAEVQAREAKRRKGRATGITSVDMVQATENSSRVYEDLRKKFSDAEARDFADRVLRRGAQARRHALAMKQLSDRFSIADLQSLNADERAKWLGLLKGHAEKFLTETAALERELQTVFPDLGGGSGAGTPGSDREIQASVRRLYELAVNADEDLRGSFALLTTGGSAEVKTAKFWRTLNTATALARAVRSAN